MQLKSCAIYLKSSQYCKSNILQFKKNGLSFGISLDLIHTPKSVWWSDKLSKYWVKQTSFPTLFSISESLLMFALGISLSGLVDAVFHT